jgi:hypothetical protein
MTTRLSRAQLNVALVGGEWGVPLPGPRKQGLSAEQYQRLETQLSGLEDFAGLMLEELREDYADDGQVTQAATQVCRSICKLRKILKLAQESV